MANTFDLLQEVNVNGHTEKKKTGNAELTYLSWPFAWAEVKKRFPEAHYEIEKFDGLPYVFDPKTGYMVYTTVTIEGITHEMWLPVMDGANKAMKDVPYTYTSGYGQYAKEKRVEAATMFDINKTIMRCLVKNLAMFGLGLYIFAGEDLPMTDENTVVKQAEEQKMEAVKAETIDTTKMGIINAALQRAEIPLEKVLAHFGITSIGEMTEEMFFKTNEMINTVEAERKKRAKTAKKNEDAGNA